MCFSIFLLRLMFVYQNKTVACYNTRRKYILLLSLLCLLWDTQHTHTYNISIFWCYIIWTFWEPLIKYQFCCYFVFFCHILWIYKIYILFTRTTTCTYLKFILYHSYCGAYSIANIRCRRRKISYDFITIMIIIYISYNNNNDNVVPKAEQRACEYLIYLIWAFIQKSNAIYMSVHGHRRRHMYTLYMLMMWLLIRHQECSIQSFQYDECR